MDRNTDFTDTELFEELLDSTISFVAKVRGIRRSRVRKVRMGVGKVRGCGFACLWITSDRVERGFRPDSGTDQMQECRSGPEKSWPRPSLIPSVEQIGIG